MRRILTLLLFLMCMPGAVADPLAVGDIPADLLGKTPESEEVRISHFKGRVVLVTFWASWCRYCREELPYLDALQRRAGELVRVIAVNVQDSAEDYRYIRRQLGDTPMTFTRDKSGAISKGFGVEGYPNLFVIDQTGAVAAIHVGFGDDSFKAIIEDVIALLEHPVRAAPGVAPPV